jgi:hypothetical protein
MAYAVSTSIGSLLRVDKSKAMVRVREVTALADLALP